MEVVYKCEHMELGEDGKYHCEYRDRYADWVGSHISMDWDHKPVAAIMGIICPKRKTFMQEPPTCIKFENR